MAIAKRFILFFLTNILVVITISTLLRVTGLDSYLLTQFGAGYQSLFLFCLIWGGAGSFISLLLSKVIAKWSMGVEIVEETGPYKALVLMVHRLARKANLKKMPEVGVYESPEVNAFATGPSRSNSLVAVSTGLLSAMNDEELEGVLGHEIAHIANGDMVTMSLIQGVINAFVMFFTHIILNMIDNAMRDSEGRGGLGFMGRFFLSQVLHMAIGLLALPIVAGFSRWREYRADKGGAQIAGRTKMIAALTCLQRTYDRLQDHEGPIQTMSISSKTSFAELFSTHPTLEKRIKALRQNF